MTYTGKTAIPEGMAVFVFSILISALLQPGHR